MRIAPALIALAVLTGCAVQPDLSGTQWARPQATFQDVTLDEVECARQADDAGDTPDLIVGGLADVVRFVIEGGQRRTTFGQCMAARGYQPAGS